MKVIKITAREAQKISRELGLDIGGSDDGITYYATDERRTGVWCFDTKKERDDFVNRDRR